MATLPIVNTFDRRAGIISALVAMIVAAIFGFIVGTPALRLRGDYLGIMTLGFGEIVKVILTNLEITNGAQGLTGIPTIMSFPIAYFTMIIVVSIIALFMTSRHGRAMLSIREDEIASESVGINIFKYKDILLNITMLEDAQSLNEIIEILTKARFRIYMSIPGNNSLKSPYMGLRNYNNMDFQLNIFAHII